jgi:hypothetical protein
MIVGSFVFALNDLSVSAIPPLGFGPTAFSIYNGSAAERQAVSDTATKWSRASMHWKIKARIQNAIAALPSAISYAAYY